MAFRPRAPPNEEQDRRAFSAEVLKTDGTGDLLDAMMLPSINLERIRALARILLERNALVERPAPYATRLFKEVLDDREGRNRGVHCMFAFWVLFLNSPWAIRVLRNHIPEGHLDPVLFHAPKIMDDMYAGVPSPFFPGPCNQDITYPTVAITTLATVFSMRPIREMERAAREADSDSDAFSVGFAEEMGDIDIGAPIHVDGASRVAADMNTHT